MGKLVSSEKFLQNERKKYGGESGTPERNLNNAQFSYIL
jgi:hypothetical protein